MCGVVATHTGLLIPFSNKIHMHLSNGYKGIFLFFITSSFSLFYTLHNRDGSEINYKRFFVRRFSRIVPLYYVVLLVALVQHLLSPKIPEYITTSNILAHFLFFDSINPNWIGNGIYGFEWVVSVMVLFYFLVPILYKYIKNKVDAIIALICSIIAATIFIATLEPFNVVIDLVSWSWFLRSNLIFLLPVFIMGVLLYFLVFPEHPGSQKKKGNYKLVFLLTLTAGIFIIKSTFWYEPDYIISIGFVALGYLLSKYPLKIIVNPVFCYLGRISYNIYLTHLFIIVYLGKLMKIVNLPYPNVIQYIIAFILVMLLSTLISTATYAMIEKKGISLGETLITRFSL